MYDEDYFDSFFIRVSKELKKKNIELPSVSTIAIKYKTPFSVLISTLISLRTKDIITLEASYRILDKANNVDSMLNLKEDEIAKLIYPCAFYKTKAKNIINICNIIKEKYNGKVPNNSENLLKLPGVGIKTANLVLNLGFNKNAICVDCHVHQIANRLNWISTKTAEESEKELQNIMPTKYWIPLNELLVSFGQNICTSISPKCSICTENNYCPKINIKYSR